MFLLKSLSAIFHLILTTALLHESYQHPNIRVLIMLTIQTITSIFYEIGRLQDSNHDLVLFFMSIWNQMNLLSLLCLLWAIVSYWINIGYPHGHGHGHGHGQIALSFSIILQSLGLLQYLCLNRKLGQLVIMLIAMIKDVFLFIIIFLFSILGFGIAFHGLYGSLDQSSYGNGYSTFQTLFIAINGNLNFHDFDGSGYASVGSALLMIYTTFVGIVLLNLLIAKMANTYSNLLSHTEDEWGFLTVSYHSLVFSGAIPLIMTCIIRTT